MANERILIIDDEEDVLELVRYNFDRSGYQIETPSTGEQALSKARKNTPDLIILDLFFQITCKPRRTILACPEHSRMGRATKKNNNHSSIINNHLLRPLFA